MTIANPIYDIVFKYLMEDLDIAKGLLSTILDVEIQELTIQPQETITETLQESQNLQTLRAIRVFRIDFAAIIKQSDGQTKKVLIELQKTKINSNALRFRRYLAENYQKEDTIIENGKEKKRPLEIITIYLLGFSLNKIPTAILHSKPYFHDVVNNTSAEEYAHLEEFIKLLTHESYFIQIPKLVEPTKTRVEKVLSIFNQTFKSSDEHSLNYNLTADDDPLLKKMVNRLIRAIADDEMRRKMNIEDEIESDFADFHDTIEKKEKEIKQKDQELEQKKQKLVQKDQELELKDQELELKDQELEQEKQKLVQKDQEIAELRRLLNSRK